MAIKAKLMNTSARVHAASAEGATMPAKGKTTGKPGVTTAGVQATATVSISADRINAKAREFAELLNESEEFTADMNAGIEAATTMALSPRDLYFDFSVTLGEDRLKASPIPGTKIKMTLADGSEVFNNNPDEYKAPKTDGSTGDVSRFFWRDVADSTDIGKVIAADIVAAKKRIDGGDKIGGTLDLEAAQARQKTLRNNVNQAASLFHQLSAIEAYPGANADWVWEDKKNNVLRRTPKCICIEDSDFAASKLFTNMTVRQFLTLDCGAAMSSSKTAVGGTYQRLLETRRQDGDEDAGNEENKVATVQDLDGVAVRFLNYMLNDDNMLTLKKKLKQPGDFSDRLLLALQQIEDCIEEATVGMEGRIRELKTMQAAGDDRLNRRKAS